MEQYNFINKLSVLSEIVPQVKFKMILTLSAFILLSFISYMVFRFEFPKVKKLFIINSLVISVIGLAITYKEIPNNENELYYPKYNEKQKITILSNNQAILEGQFGDMYLVNEGRLSPLKDK